MLFIAYYRSYISDPSQQPAGRSLVYSLAMNAQTLQGKVLLILPSKEHLHLIDLQLVPADARTLFWGSA